MTIEESVGDFKETDGVQTHKRDVLCLILTCDAKVNCCGTSGRLSSSELELHNSLHSVGLAF